MMKKFLKSLLPIFAMFEGVDHLVMSALSYYGFYRDHLTLTGHWLIWLTPLFDTFFGVLSIITSLVLHESLHSHHK